MRLKIFLSTFLVLFLLIAVNGQITAEKSVLKIADLKETTKIDEFGDISAEEIDRKLENFQSLLQKNKDLRGFVIYYSGFNEPFFNQTAYNVRRRTREFDNFLCNKFPGTLIDSRIGGLREKKTIELWVVPPDGVEPETQGDTELPRDLLYRFDLLETDLLEFEAVMPENGNQAEVGFKIKNRMDLEDLLNVAGDVLQKEASRRAVLIYYLDDSKGNIPNFRQAFEKFIEDNAVANQLDLRRVKIIYGGHREHPVVESWSIPNDESDPALMPDKKDKCIY